MNYKSLISNGKSVRDFKEKSIERKYLDETKAYIKESKKLIENIDIEILDYANVQCYEKLKSVAGYHGYMIKAPNYMLILSDVKNGYIENGGYIGEKLVLKARDLGIDSCWVTFENSNIIKERLDINSTKEIVAIIALGYENNKVTKNKSSAQRMGVEKIVYVNEWNNNISINELEERGLFDAFSYARIAPSTLNRQPWRFILDGDKVVLVVKKDDFASDYESKIDTGIAMLYFGVIIDTTMFDLKWSLERIDKDYKIPSDYEIVGYCNI